MKTLTKILLAVGLCLLLVGAALFAGVMAKNDWDFEALGKGSYETRSYTPTESFQSISIHAGTEDILFRPSADGSCRVEFLEPKDAAHSAAVEDGTLRIGQSGEQDWLDRLLSFSFQDPTITVWLPAGDYAELFIEAGTGKIDIPADFRFARIDVTASTGDVDCRASASASIGITTGTGHIRLSELRAAAIGLTVSTGRVELRGIDCEGELRVQVSTGRTELTEVSCGSLVSYGSTGDLRMKELRAAETITVERSTGDVRLEACDAQALEIATDTGDVKGSLLSGKVFIVRSDTGRIRVPETTAGGKCKITTDTGDIEISISQNP